MSRQLHFFATKFDLVTGIKTIESVRRLKYSNAGLLKTANPIVYNSVECIDDFGVNKTGKHLSPYYLVINENKEFSLIKILQFDGTVCYSLSQNANESSIAFSPGGIYQNRFLICGHIGTIKTENIESIELYKQFKKSMLKQFKKIKGFYVGPEAMNLYYNGIRLITMGVDESEDDDLKLD